MWTRDGTYVFENNGYKYVVDPRSRTVFCYDWIINNTNWHSSPGRWKPIGRLNEEDEKRFLRMLDKRTLPGMSYD